MPRRPRQAMRAAAIAVIVSAAASADAGVMFYTDLSTFDAASDTSVVETFEGVLPKNKSLPSFVSNGNTYTGLGGTPVSNVYAFAPGAKNFGVSETTSTVLTANGDEDFRIDFGAPGTAVGFDTYLNGFGPATISILGLDGLLGVYELTHAANVVGFFGVTSDVAIKSIRFTTVNGRAKNTGIDNVRVGAVTPEADIPSAPEPGTLALLGLGSVGMAFGAWRKKRGAASVA